MTKKHLTVSSYHDASMQSRPTLWTSASAFDDSADPLAWIRPASEPAYDAGDAAWERFRKTERRRLWNAVRLWRTVPEHAQRLASAASFPRRFIATGRKPLVTAQELRRLCAYAVRMLSALAPCHEASTNQAGGFRTIDSNGRVHQVALRFRASCDETHQEHQAVDIELPTGSCPQTLATNRQLKATADGLSILNRTSARLGAIGRSLPLSRAKDFAAATAIVDALIDRHTGTNAAECDRLRKEIEHSARMIEYGINVPLPGQVDTGSLQYRYAEAPTKPTRYNLSDFYLSRGDLATARADLLEVEPEGIDQEDYRQEEAPGRTYRMVELAVWRQGMKLQDEIDHGLFCGVVRPQKDEIGDYTGRQEIVRDRIDNRRVTVIPKGMRYVLVEDQGSAKR